MGSIVPRRKGRADQAREAPPPKPPPQILIREPVVPYSGPEVLFEGVPRGNVGRVLQNLTDVFGEVSPLSLRELGPGVPAATAAVTRGGEFTNLPPQSRLLLSYYCKCRPKVRVLVAPLDFVLKEETRAELVTHGVLRIPDEALRDAEELGLKKTDSPRPADRVYRVLVADPERTPIEALVYKSRAVAVTPDFHSTVVVAETLFHERSWSLLGSSRAFEEEGPFRACRDATKRLEWVMRAFLSPVERECVRVDASYSLFVHGFRPVRDFELSVVNPFDMDFTKKVFSVFGQDVVRDMFLHSVSMEGLASSKPYDEWLRRYPERLFVASLAELNFQPRHLTWFCGIKTLSLEAVSAELLDRIEHRAKLGCLADVLVLRRRPDLGVPVPRLQGHLTSRRDSHVPLSLQSLGQHIRSHFKKKYDEDVTDNDLDAFVELLASRSPAFRSV